jgi:hypothetical protein
MSGNSMSESFIPSNLRRSSDDILLKHVTLLNAQTQKALWKMTIPKVLVLYTGSLEQNIITDEQMNIFYFRRYNWYESVKKCL